MNEKIKSLALEAHIHFDDSKQSRIHFVNTDTLEKFAELIVRECYNHCKEETLDTALAEEHKLGYNDGVADCAVGLLQHFGLLNDKDF